MGSPTPPAVRPVVRRVRHGVRDGIAVMAFSAGTSAAIAALLTLVTHLALG